MKKKLRIAIDSGMVLLLPLLMAYSMVGEATHEYLGIGMFLLFIAHHILNIAWWKNIFHGRYTLLRIVGTTVNFVLAIIMLLKDSGRHSCYFKSTTQCRTQKNMII